MDATRNVVMNVYPICDVDKGKKIQRHLAQVHGYSQEQIEEFKLDKKNQKIAASGKTTKHADEYSPPTIPCPICGEGVRNAQDYHVRVYDNLRKH
ncbi:hypothetical protein RB195_023643 [Necator americanus]|uniref:C2H2-type domain-containing protein n=1 Tax=Necator americanus TaxID=51031 RepID=A0ABR1EK72_NECAM